MTDKHSLLHPHHTYWLLAEHIADVLSYVDTPSPDDVRDPGWLDAMNRKTKAEFGTLLDLTPQWTRCAVTYDELVAGQRETLNLARTLHGAPEITLTELAKVYPDRIALIGGLSAKLRAAAKLPDDEPTAALEEIPGTPMTRTEGGDDWVEIKSVGYFSLERNRVGVHADDPCKLDIKREVTSSASAKRPSYRYSVRRSRLADYIVPRYLKEYELEDNRQE